MECPLVILPPVATGVILNPEVLFGFGEGCPERRGREGGAVLTAVLLGKVARR